MNEYKKQDRDGSEARGYLTPPQLLGFNQNCPVPVDGVFLLPCLLCEHLLMADDWIPAALSSTTGYGQKRRYEERRRPF